MRYSLAILLLIVWSATPALAQTQLDLNQAAHEQYLQADKELNEVWNELTPKLSPKVKDKLVEAQLRWLKFRDAEAEARAAVYEGGSMAPLVRSESLTDSTRQRTERLRAWLEVSR